MEINSCGCEERNKELELSGTILYLKENTAELKKFNQRQDNQARWLKGFVVLGYIGFIYLMIMTYYVIHYGVVNNIVAHCRG